MAWLANHRGLRYRGKRLRKLIGGENQACFGVSSKVDAPDRASRILPICTGSGELSTEGGETTRAHTPHEAGLRLCERSMGGAGVHLDFFTIKVTSSRASQFMAVRR
jgi:hypothetical protein